MTRTPSAFEKLFGNPDPRPYARMEAPVEAHAEGIGMTVVLVLLGLVALLLWAAAGACVRGAV